MRICMEYCCYVRVVATNCCEDILGKLPKQICRAVGLFPYLCGRSTCFSNRLHGFSVAIPRCYEDVYANSFFSRIAGPWNYLPVECSLSTCDRNSAKS